MSRVRDFSALGVFILSETPAARGSRLKLLFSLPEGEIPVQGIVRNSLPGTGMGVEFVGMGGKELDVLLAVAKRLAGERIH